MDGNQEESRGFRDEIKRIRSKRMEDDGWKLYGEEIEYLMVQILMVFHAREMWSQSLYPEEIEKEFFSSFKSIREELMRNSPKSPENSSARSVKRLYIVKCQRMLESVGFSGKDRRESALKGPQVSCGQIDNVFLYREIVERRDEGKEDREVPTFERSSLEGDLRVSPLKFCEERSLVDGVVVEEALGQSSTLSVCLANSEQPFFLEFKSGKSGKKDRKVPKPVVRGGGGDIEDSEETEKKIQKVELVRQVDSKTAVCRVEYPSNDLFQCYFKDCKTMSQAGYGSEDMKYLTRHFEKAHYTKVTWTYRCGKCQAKADGDGTAATRWVNSHMKSAHREKAVNRIKSSYERDTAKRAMEALNQSAPSLPKPNKGLPRKKDVITAPTVVHSTPEKIQELESKIQTRTVTKSLSVLKESAKKKELMEGKSKKTFPLFEIAEEKRKNARKSLANILKAESPRVVQPDIVLGESVDLKKLTGPERVKMAREQSKRQSRLSIQRRMSFAPSVNSPKIVEEKLQKEESEEIEKKSENEKTQEDVELDLNRTFVIEDDDEIEFVQRRFNTWCLDHETTEEAYISDDVIEFYMKGICAKNEKYKYLDPCIWETVKLEGPMQVKQTLWSQKTYFFPVCEKKHWILLIIDSERIWYADSLRQEPRGEVEKFIKSMNRKREFFETPVPEQTDGVNCGVHVCLVAKAIAEGKKNWYEEREVPEFRTTVKKMLRDKGYELFSEPYGQQLEQKKQETATEEAKIDNSREISGYDFDTGFDMPDNTREVFEKEISEEKSIIAEEEDIFVIDAEKKEDLKAKSSIPKLMEQKLEKPEIVPRREEIKEKRSQKMAKKQKVPTGKPDELVLRVQKWFEKEFESYVEEGKSFQRLEWITEVLTAAIHKASAGDEEAIEKIEKRCPPMEVEEGEMFTQTEVKRRYKSKKGPRPETSSEELREVYWENRAKTFNILVGNESKQCEIPIKRLEEFFTKTTSVTDVPKNILEEKSSKIPKVKIDDWIETDFTEKELAEVLKKTKDTAPGVDGLRYHHLSWFDPSSKFLTLLYNECKEHRRIPAHWKEAETVLLYKGGDESKPENWRPISLMPTIYKLYSSLWNRRIRSIKGIMSRCQRGFQEREGCNESIGILRAAIDVAKGKKSNLSVAWLDLTNAFGSVPHELIKHTLETYGFPEIVVQIIMDMYKGAAIRVKSKNEKSDRILIKSGVKQGDPISPTLFNMCLENVIRRHLETANGHKCLNTRVKVLAFADDMAILSESKTQLQNELLKMDEDCTPLNLIFKPAKCASLVIEKGRVKSDAEIKLKSQSIRSLTEKDTYKYLGVQTGIETRKSELELMKSATKELEMVYRSKLTPPQKLDCVRTFVLPKMSYMYANSVPKLTELKAFANMTMRAVKMMHGIPVKGSPVEYVQLPVGKGGLGIACPKITALITYLVSMMKKLWSKDKYIEKLFSEYLKKVAEAETGIEDATLEDMAEYLSNEKPVDKKAFGYNSFTRIREVCRGLCGNKDSPLFKIKIVVKDGKLAILTQAIKDGKEKIFTEERVKNLQALLKAEVTTALLHRFNTEKPVKSEVVRVIQQYPQCNKFVRIDGKVSYAAQRFVHKARLNLLACNYNTYSDVVSKACRRCGYEKESQWHILSSCKFGMAKKIMERHDSVLYKVKKLIESGNGKQIILADVTVPYEHGVEAMQRAWDKKVDKYTDSFAHLKVGGASLSVLPIVVGTLGTWWKPTSKSLEELGIEKRSDSKSNPEICSTVLEQK
ncbi:hypothetical protein B9Z55_028815 [Caenorhabditis nigoni]|uniref:Reverse transcriptase domain-containing protein n=1 Tax=Caenorhabditis nigoni TaxID=1611254 RepID=A0A2G5S9X0_9PELO|nr:hypothetical protein B9Z55_028815 [Caenorhabditis nigoni]